MSEECRLSPGSQMDATDGRLGGHGTGRRCSAAETEACGSTSVYCLCSLAVILLLKIVPRLWCV